MTFVSELEPRTLWSHFDQILAIPRPSKGEEAMRRHVLDRAAARDLEVRRDAAGNVVVVVPATPGHEDAPVTVLQSHLDMVQEKNSDVDFDFTADAIKPVRDGDYLTADGTTLGSDNGIGVAAMLALIDSDDVEHGPLELLFTIDEETGLTGASELGEDLLQGRRLLNLDTEEEGALYVGCAGGGDSLLRLPLSTAGVSGTVLDVKVAGLKGGHSGVDIHLQRGNAIKVLARGLHAAFLATGAPPRLVSLHGGTAHNAIPREAFATVAVAASQEEAFRAALEHEFAAAARELRPVEPDMRLEVTAGTGADAAWDETTSHKVLDLLEALPHGVQTMSYDIPDLVETSTNLATVEEQGGKLEILLSSRSSVATAIGALRARIRGAAHLAGAEAVDRGGYPGWQPDMDSELLKVMRRVHERELGQAPEVKAVHAGLETGIIGQKYPGMDMISFGPQIEYPHSPDERVHVASVERFWQLLKATLKELAA